MSSIFPFINKNNTKTTVNNTLPMFKEYAWDIKKNDFKLENGKFKIIQGADALAIWIYKALKTERFKYLAYSQNYGCEIENLIGTTIPQNILTAEAKRYLEEALLINKYIARIENVQTNVSEYKLDITFTAITVYGNVEQELSV